MYLAPGQYSTTSTSIVDGNKLLNDVPLLSLLGQLPDDLAGIGLVAGGGGKVKGSPEENKVEG